MISYYLKRKDWEDFLLAISQNYSIYGLIAEEGLLFYSIISSEKFPQVVYNGVRAVYPIKSFFFSAKDRVLPTPEVDKKIILLGVKACDLTGLSILDKVFMESDYPDPLYQKRRTNTLIITSDCSTPYESCFCVLQGYKPYPETGFDLNFSVLDDGFIVEVGSEKGEKIISEIKQYLQNVTESQLQCRNNNREQVVNKIKENNARFRFDKSLKELVTANYESSKWEQAAQTCVMCGCCTNACPTCVCYMLEDLSRDKEFIKLRAYDTCQLSGYARVASGANPRPILYERLRNRYFCKHTYMVENYNLLGCTGCGRCIVGCPGKIDMREVINNLG